MDGLTALDLMTTGVAGFMLAFARVGTAVMLMPGLGDSFSPARIRLHVALALTFVLFPLISATLPAAPGGPIALAALVAGEVLIGLLVGTIARVFMMALDTAGMVISIQSGLGSAQIFNPSLAAQGSLIGAMLSVAGIVFLFATNLHHLLILGVVESYRLFPAGAIPDTGSMAEVMVRAVAASFALGVALAGPFIAVTLLIYAGMGVLTRLMPQMHVFLIALPLQILISLVILGVSGGAILTVWAERFAAAVGGFLGG